MDKKIDTALPILAALLVLFSSLWRPETTLAVSIVSLIVLAGYYYLKPRRK
ncbi:MAG: hypothetical protein Q7S31_04095 [bacterium]|nr:hypothetical protein [bacterium]